MTRGRSPWTEALWDTFQERYGYDLRGELHRINKEPHIRYDQRKLVGETVVREFYATFTEICHELGARSRVQCHGSPTDLILACASVDIPETEVILYNPHFSRTPASAAALCDKNALSCETFNDLLRILTGHAKAELSEVPARPLLRGYRLPWFWARQDGLVTWVFLAHPKTRNLKYPMAYASLIATVLKS